MSLCKDAINTETRGELGITTKCREVNYLTTIKTTQKMKTIIDKTIEATLILASIILLGMFIPIVFATFISITSDYTFQQCSTENVLFWIISIVGMIIAGVYLDILVSDN